MKNEPLKTVGARLLDFDERTRALFEQYGDTPAMSAADVFSKLGDQPQVRMISGAILLAGIIRGDARLVRAGARMIVAHEAATFVKNRLKNNLNRRRPRSGGDREDRKLARGREQAKEETSFPSGHSAGAMAAGRAFAREFPEYAPASVGLAGLVAVSQIPRCAHYPTDVAAGLAVGLAAEAAVDSAWRSAGLSPDDSEEDYSSSAPIAAPASTDATATSR